MLVYSWFAKDSGMRSIKKSKTISSSIGGLKLNKSLRLYVKIIWIFTKNPGFPLSFVLEIVRGRHSAPKKNRSKGSKYYSEKYVQFWGQRDWNDTVKKYIHFVTGKCNTFIFVTLVTRFWLFQTKLCLSKSNNI